MYGDGSGVKYSYQVLLPCTTLHSQYCGSGKFVIIRHPGYMYPASWINVSDIPDYTYSVSGIPDYPASEID